jgi:hypothetical protein
MEGQLWRVTSLKVVGEDLNSIFFLDKSYREEKFGLLLKLLLKYKPELLSKSCSPKDPADAE